MRRYRARCYGKIKQSHLDKLKDGITIDGIHYGEVDAKLESEQGANAWIEMFFRDRFYHADPHPGNLMALPGGVIGFLKNVFDPDWASG